MIYPECGKVYFIQRKLEYTIIFLFNVNVYIWSRHLHYFQLAYIPICFRNISWSNSFVSAVTVCRKHQRLSRINTIWKYFFISVQIGRRPIYIITRRWKFPVWLTSHTYCTIPLCSGSAQGPCEHTRDIPRWVIIRSMLWWLRKANRKPTDNVLISGVDRCVAAVYWRMYHFVHLFPAPTETSDIIGYLQHNICNGQFNESTI